MDTTVSGGAQLPGTTGDTLMIYRESDGAMAHSPRELRPYNEKNNPLHGDGTCFETVMAEHEFICAPGVSAFRTEIGPSGRSNGTSCPCGDLSAMSDFKTAGCRGDAIVQKLAWRGTAPGTGASQNAMRFGRTSGFVHTPCTTNTKCPTRGHLVFGGEGGIRTHVPGLPDHLISSQRRYGHFGTSPESYCRRS